MRVGNLARRPCPQRGAIGFDCVAAQVKHSMQFWPKRGRSRWNLNFLAGIEGRAAVRSARLEADYRLACPPQRPAQGSSARRRTRAGGKRISGQCRCAADIGSHPMAGAPRVTAILAAERTSAHLQRLRRVLPAGCQQAGGRRPGLLHGEERVHADGRSCRPLQRRPLRRAGAEIAGEAS